jgi:hypothetical protein
MNTRYDLFAAHALQGLFSNMETVKKGTDWIVAHAFNAADTMMAHKKQLRIVSNGQRYRLMDGDDNFFTIPLLSPIGNQPEVYVLFQTDSFEDAKRVKDQNTWTEVDESRRAKGT